MGYTHYWRMTKDIPQAAWDEITKDAAKLIAASPVKLAFESGDNDPPVIGPDLIRFNAFDEDEACETFLIFREHHDFEFCKTREYPYDTVVCGILSVVAEHAGKVIKISSDGGAVEWDPPLVWASRILGRTVKRPF